MPPLPPDALADEPDPPAPALPDWLDELSRPDPPDCEPVSPACKWHYIHTEQNDITFTENKMTLHFHTEQNDITFTQNKMTSHSHRTKWHYVHKEQNDITFTQNKMISHSHRIKWYHIYTQRIRHHWEKCNTWWHHQNFQYKHTHTHTHTHTQIKRNSTRSKSTSCTDSAAFSYIRRFTQSSECRHSTHGIWELFHIFPGYSEVRPEA